MGFFCGFFRRSAQNARVNRSIAQCDENDNQRNSLIVISSCRRESSRLMETILQLAVPGNVSSNISRDRTQKLEHIDQCSLTKSSRAYPQNCAILRSAVIQVIRHDASMIACPHFRGLSSAGISSIYQQERRNLSRDKLRNAARPGRS